MAKGTAKRAPRSPQAAKRGAGGDTPRTLANRIVEYLAADDYVTEAQERAAARVQQFQDRDALGGALVAAFVGTVHPLFPDPDPVSRFAGFLVLALGRDRARRAVLRQIDGHGFVGVLLLDALAGHEEWDIDQESLVGRFRSVTRLVAPALARSGADPWELCSGLCTFPSPGLDIVVRELLSSRRLGPEAWAPLAMLFPLPGRARLAIAEWLAGCGEPGRAYLTRLGPADLGAELADRVAGLLAGTPVRPPRARKSEGGSRLAPDLRESPLDWPVIAAFATAPDGRGSQSLVVCRRRPDGSFAAAGTVVNEKRGIADGWGHPRIDPEEWEEFLADLHGALDLLEVTPGYAAGRVREGMAVAARSGIPLVHDFRVSVPLLAGVAGYPREARDEAVRGWAREGSLADGEFLCETAALGSWFFPEDGTYPIADFLAECRPSLAFSVRGAGRTRKPDAKLAAELRRQGAAGEPWPFTPVSLAAIDGAIRRHVAAIFDREHRARLSDRLAQIAYLFHCEHLPRLRDVAAAAALAAAPDSGVPIEDQPVPAAMLRVSVVRNGRLRRDPLL